MEIHCGAPVAPVPLAHAHALASQLNPNLLPDLSESDDLLLTMYPESLCVFPDVVR